MAENNLNKMNALAGVMDRESKTYSFEKTISMGGEEKTGAFTAKYMGIGARLRMGTIRAKLLDGAPIQSIDNVTDDIAFMIAYLQVTLVKMPQWFNYDQIDDYDDLRNLYEEVYNFHTAFREKNENGENAGSSETTTSKTFVESVQRTPIANK